MPPAIPEPQIVHIGSPKQGTKEGEQKRGVTSKHFTCGGGGVHSAREAERHSSYLGSSKM